MLSFDEKEVELKENIMKQMEDMGRIIRRPCTTYLTRSPVQESNDHQPSNQLPDNNESSDQPVSRRSCYTWEELESLSSCSKMDYMMKC